MSVYEEFPSRNQRTAIYYSNKPWGTGHSISLSYGIQRTHCSLRTQVDVRSLICFTPRREMPRFILVARNEAKSRLAFTDYNEQTLWNPPFLRTLNFITYGETAEYLATWKLWPQKAHLRSLKEHCTPPLSSEKPRCHYFEGRAFKWRDILQSSPHGVVYTCFEKGHVQKKRISVPDNADS